MNKYEGIKLPTNPETAGLMASEREEWAKEARAKDLHGSAKEWELTAALLRAYAQQLLAQQAKALYKPELQNPVTRS